MKAGMRNPEGENAGLPDRERSVRQSREAFVV